MPADRLTKRRRSDPQWITRAESWSVIGLAVGALTFSHAAVTSAISDRTPKGDLIGTGLWAAAAVIGYLSAVRGRRVGNDKDRTTVGRHRLLAATAGMLAIGLALAAVIWAPRGANRVHVVDVVVAYPVGEEAVFRGLVWVLIASRLGSRSARQRAITLVTATAALFAVSHIQYHGFRLDATTLSQVAYTLPAGVALGLLRLSTGGILGPVLAHSGGNAALKLLASVP